MLIFIKESTFVNVAKPRNGWFGHKNGLKYGFLGKFGQKPILWAIIVAKPPISGLSNIYKSWFFYKNEQLFFYKVFKEIGSSGFTEFGSASMRTDASKYITVYYTLWILTGIP